MKCFGVFFVCVFNIKYSFLFQDSSDFRPYLLIKDCKYSSFTLFFVRVFHVFIFTLWTWSRLRRQARPKTTGVAGTCKHEIIILVASVSAHLVNARVVEHFFLRCSSFERASRSLAKTGFPVNAPAGTVLNKEFPC